MEASPGRDRLGVGPHHLRGRRADEARVRGQGQDEEDQPGHQEAGAIPAGVEQGRQGSVHNVLRVSNGELVGKCKISTGLV